MGARRLPLVFCLLAVVVVLGGCAVLDVPSSDPEPDPETVFEAAFVHGDDLVDVRGERTTTVTDGDETVTEVASVVERPYVEYRSEVLESSMAATAGDVYVSNATASWWYDPESNAASVYEVDEPHENEAVEAARADQAERQLERYDLEYLGTETVADRETYVLTVEAKDEVVEDGISVLVGDTEYVYALETVDPADELVALEQTIWIDAEYEYPLKEELVFEGPNGERKTMTERFEEVSFNNDLPDGTFAFEPAENVTVDEIE
ncbi:outer membrane lipoprotein carrier protein LolA [Natrarchaeobius halalkaliphilus]|uniref:Outer membrane lipoprotein carrier protein LolA n=1 Tax=Natrarchaeobius halalkaliphilus TaxID=1679091 RepID=A0A3N6M4Q0_9EURY|nr:outer membrane lipoprotein carrier protein LolA [Natrarchaeobius halalkaliphilus]RQG90211.1 outer membrane lipoprotein carrier protein LolA [Natrarchaeobius halalkaliphilus]